MAEIKCPNCGSVFNVDESNYASIVSQIRDKEFDAELNRRLQEIEKSKQQEMQIALMQKNQDIKDLQSKIESANLEKDLAVNEAISEKDKELAEKEKKIIELKGSIDNQASQYEIKEKSIIDNYEKQLKLKDESIEFYKDFKARQSTKMVGESLEQHCMIEFNNIRMAAFPKAYFEKDNDAKTGSKGDFIFRESTDDGVEFISIMFEMKNEMDETATKHKNEDFFKELDKDRKEKNCEYAVLVSLLESDNDYYNNGIVDVSYRYEKMYVIRPQFFIPLITLLRNAALNSVSYRQELQVLKNQQVDLTNFEANLLAFKDNFAKNYDRASQRFNSAIEGIEKAINVLNKIRDDLLASENQLRLANGKIDDITIKKLTKNAPSIKAQIEEARKNAEANGSETRSLE